MLTALILPINLFVYILAFLDIEEKKLNKKNIVRILNKIFKQKFYTLTLILTSILQMIFVNQFNNVDIFSFIVILVNLILSYSSIVDLFSYRISIFPIYFAIAIGVVFNLIILVTNNISWGSPYINFIAGLAGFSLFLIIYLATNKKGMGDGDMYVMAAISLIIGIEKSVIAFYFMVIVGSIIGLLIGIIKGELKGLRLPFVPFMYLGFCFALLYGDQILQWYSARFLGV